MHIAGIILVLVIPWLFNEWYARYVFVACGYRRRDGHGKSFHRAKKHYKENWSFFQRLFWLPVFKNRYENRIRRMAILSYLHGTVMVITCSCFLLDEFVLHNVQFWRYLFILTSSFLIIRYVHDNRIATS